MKILAEYVANKFENAEMIRVVPKENGSFDVITSKNESKDN